MNNKPSLFDIEAFNKSRDLETEAELEWIEKESQIFNPTGNNTREAELQTIINIQKDDIDRISKELKKSINLQNTYKALLLKQKEEISSLGLELNRQQEEGTGDKKPVINNSDDPDNYQLILDNIVMLIDEKRFSTNDVARLFKAEDMLPPFPFSKWDVEAVKELYEKAKHEEA